MSKFRFLSISILTFLFIPLETIAQDNLTDEQRGYISLAAIGLSALLLLYMYIQWKLKSIDEKKKYLKAGFSNSILWSVLLLILSIVMVNTIQYKAPVDHNEEIVEKEDTRTAKEIMDSIRLEEVKLTNQIRYEMYNYDLHFEYIQAHFVWPQKKYEDYSLFRKDDVILYNYRKRSCSKDTRLAEVGRFGLTLSFLNLEQLDSAKFYYDLLLNKNRAYIHYSFAKYYKGKNSYGLAEENYLKEISLTDGYSTRAYPELVGLYIQTGQKSKIKTILFNEVTKKYVPKKLAIELYFLSFKLVPYTAIIWQGFIHNLNWVGFFAALIIGLIWQFYLLSLDKFEKERWWNILVLFILGGIFAFGALYLYDFYKYVLKFDLTGKLLNDFFYSVFGIGAVEELVKILPVLILLRSKFINKPYDIILYAATSALGFAFVENLIYFKDFSGGIFHARSLTSVVGHMIDSTFVAYGLILGRFRYPGQKLKYFLLYFLMAATVHGMYDLILFFSHYTFLLIVLFFVYFLYLVRIWILLINNALNNSPFFDYDFKYSRNRIQSVLILCLTLVLVFEYFVQANAYGTYAANQYLKASLISESFLLLFLASNLSKLDFVKGYWRRISFSPDKINKTGMENSNVLKFILNQFVLNRIIPQNYVKRKILIESWLENTSLSKIMPEEVHGTITDRKLMMDDTDLNQLDAKWFVVMLEENIEIDDFLNDLVIIRFEETDPKLDFTKDVSAYIAAIPAYEILNEDIIKKSKVKFLGSCCINTENPGTKMARD